MDLPEGLTWKTACRGRKCCPEVSLHDGAIIIRDDDGGWVQLSPAEFEDVVATVRELQGDGAA